MAIVMVADFQEGITASLFAYEGAFIAELRAKLCLIGWPWSIADQAARDLVGEALRRINAERPSWDEAQPEYVALPGFKIERTRCAECRARLPEGHFKFCGFRCAHTYHDRLSKIRRSDRDLKATLAVRSI